MTRWGEMDPVICSADSGKKSPINLTIKEKVLLHLLENFSVNESREAPPSITQKGIAKAVNIRLSHVPRAMIKLKKLGYISERMAHIKGRTRRLKTYYLTDDGMLKAKTLREKTLQKEVYLKRANGQVTKVKLLEVNSILKTNLPLLKQLHSISDGNIIEEKQLKSGVKAKKPEKEFAFYVVGEISWPEMLIGREDETETVSKWIDDNEYNTIVIYGGIGIGKTALMARIVKLYKDHRNIFWYQLTEGDTRRDISVQLAEFLSKLGRESLMNLLKNRKKPDFDDMIKAVGRDMKDMEILLAFDNYHNVPEGIVDMFSELTDIAAREPGLNILVAASDTTPVYCRFYNKRIAANKSIGEVTLKGLDMEGSKRLLGNEDIDPDSLRKIHLMTRGHPLTLELIKLGDVNSLKKIKGFSRQEASLLMYLKDVEKS